MKTPEKNVIDSNLPTKNSTRPKIAKRKVCRLTKANGTKSRSRTLEKRTAPYDAISVSRLPDSRLSDSRLSIPRPAVSPVESRVTAKKVRDKMLEPSMMARSNLTCAGLIVNLVPPLARMLRSEIAPAMGFGVSLAQFNLMSALATQSSLNNNELAEGLGVSLPVATRQVDNLVSMELVKRLRENGDRRQVRLTLTAKGRAVHQRVQERVSHALFSKLQQLQSEDRKKLEKGLLILRLLIEGSQANKPVTHQMTKHVTQDLETENE